MALFWTLAFCIFHLASGSDVVPVLFWSPERAMSNLPDVSSNDIVQPESFKGDFLTPLVKKSSQSAVVFLQDKLHMDDFTKYADVYSVDSTGGAFRNIKTLMEENFSLELPQVDQPSKVVDELRSEFTGAVHTISSLQDLEALEVSKDSPFLLLVHLTTTAGSVDQEAAIGKNDEMIGAVCDQLMKRGVKYTAMFTGKTAGQGMAEEGDVHSGRHLLEETEPEVINKNGTFLNVSDVYIFMRSISICVKNSSGPECAYKFEIVPDEGCANETMKANSTANVELAFPNITANNATSDPFNVSIKMHVFNEGDRWNIRNVILEVQPTVDTPGENSTEIKNGSLVNGALDFKVPILYSFHCTEMKLFLDSLTEYTEFKGTYITISGFQFQPFNTQQDRFLNAVDCVGFFTTAIWMGLFPVALLLAILLGGTLMLLNLSIMDRYDDPKGKTITVHTPGAE